MAGLDGWRRGGAGPLQRVADIDFEGGNVRGKSVGELGLICRREAVLLRGVEVVVVCYAGVGTGAEVEAAGARVPSMGYG